MKFLTAINYANYSDSKKKNRQDVAIAVMSRIASKERQFTTLNYPEDVVNVPSNISVGKVLQRNSRITIGNNRDLPYIKDIFDLCSTADCDIIGYVNSDILLQKSVFDMMELFASDAYVFYRTEIGEVNADDFEKGKFKAIWGGDKHEGNDAFFLNRKFWLKNRDKFPEDLILGETEWDTCYREIIKNTTSNNLIDRVLFHVFHQAEWDIKSKGALNNIRIWENIKK